MQSLLELRHLKTILAIQDSGSLTRAAERLHLTQSALSHQIRLLEDHYGLPLFARKSTPLKLTAAGEKLALLAQDVLPAIGMKPITQLTEHDLRALLRGMVSRDAYAAWLPQIDVVALDISAYSPGELDEMLTLLRSKKPGLSVLARRIDSYEEYEYCLGKGFDLA